MRFLAKWVLGALAFLTVANVFAPHIAVAGFTSALVIALVWGLLGFFVRPILLVLTLPINVLTLGLFTLIVNGFLFWLLGALLRGLYVESFGWAVLGALVLSILNALIHWFLRRVDEEGGR